MKKVELLAPAGDQESLIAAIQNGANAIYLGGTIFNARAFAKNFDNEQLLWAVQYAHLRNVRIYVTVNTLYKDEEFSKLLEYIDYLYKIQIDALIIQDIGFFQIIHSIYPDFELHISTQASVMNQFGVQFFEEIGASRVVLARENSLEEVKAVCQNTSLDIEVFIHGAMCVCYSGQCLMSSFIGKRSGNRGECAQPCRLQYKFMQDGQILEERIPYLLSPKDLMTIHQIGELIDAGVYSFKIEGRMKRPEYVGSVVKAYRKAIDNYLYHRHSSLKEDIFEMKSMFNRDYTNGYLFFDSKIVKGDYSGNKGLVIGTVVGYHKKKKRVMIQLNDKLQQGDSLVFENIDKGRPVNKIYLKNKLVAKANEGETIEIEFDYPVYNGKVRKILDKDILKNIQKTYQKENIKQPLSLLFHGRKNKPATLTVSFQDITISRSSQTLFEEAQKSSLSQDRIHQQLSKLGQTVFFAKEISIDIEDHITIPIKVINELRREAINELTKKIENKKIHFQKREYHLSLPNQKADHKEIHVMVSHFKQLQTIIHYPIHHIYYPYQEDAFNAYQLCRQNHKEMILYIPRICKDKDIEAILHSQVYQNIQKIVVNDYGSYYAFKDKEKIIGTGLNIYNSYSAHFYQEKKILSLEMSYSQMKKLHVNHQDCIVQIYGKIENMVSEYCPISQYYFGKQKKNCQLCKNHQFALIDRKNEKFELMMDEHCRMHLLNCKTLYIDDFDKILSQGLFLHFTNESTENLKIIIDDIFNCLNFHQKSQIKQIDNQKHWTLGYFKI